MQLKKDRTNELADSTHYVANHTTQRLQNGRFRRLYAGAGVLLDVSSDLPATDIPLNFSTVEVAAVLKNQGLFDKNVSLVRLMYALPKGWIKRAAMYSPTELSVFVNELYLNNFFETPDKVKELHTLVGEAFDRFMQKQMSSSREDEPTEDLADVEDLEEEDDGGDDLDTLFGGSVDSDGPPDGDGDGDSSGTRSTDIYADLPDVVAAVTGTHLLRATKKVMRVVLGRHGGETLAIARKASNELWNSYCKLLARKPKESAAEWAARAIAVGVEYAISARLLTMLAHLERLADNSADGYEASVVAQLAAASKDGVHSSPALSLAEYSKCRVCDGCGLVNGTKFVCGRCKTVKYCGADCQRRDWKRRHKVACKAAAAAAAAAAVDGVAAAPASVAVA